MDPAAPKASAEDGAFYWSRNLSQIIFAQEAAVGHHVFMDEMRYATRIEITDALVCQSAQRSREHRLAEAGAGGIGGAVPCKKKRPAGPALRCLSSRVVSWFWRGVIWYPSSARRIAGVRMVVRSKVPYSSSA